MFFKTTRKVFSADTVTQINYQRFLKNGNCFLVNPCLSVFTEVQAFLRIADGDVVREAPSVSKLRSLVH